MRLSGALPVLLVLLSGCTLQTDIGLDVFCRADTASVSARLMRSVAYAPGDSEGQRLQESVEQELAQVTAQLEGVLRGHGLAVMPPGSDSDIVVSVSFVRKKYKTAYDAADPGSAGVISTLSAEGKTANMVVFCGNVASWLHIDDQPIFPSDMDDRIRRDGAAAALTLDCFLRMARGLNEEVRLALIRSERPMSAWAAECDIHSLHEVPLETRLRQFKKGRCPLNYAELDRLRQSLGLTTASVNLDLTYQVQARFSGDATHNGHVCADGSWRTYAQFSSSWQILSDGRRWDAQAGFPDYPAVPPRTQVGGLWPWSAD